MRAPSSTNPQLSGEPQLVACAILSPFAVVTAWGLSDEFGIRRSRIVPIGLEATLIVLVLLGLSELLGDVGLLVGAVTGLCSPTALGLLARVRRRCMLDRRFEDIVRRFEESGRTPGFPEGASEQLGPRRRA